MTSLIDRNQAILAVCSVCSAVRPEYRGEKCMYFADGCEEIERLNELPSAQPEIIRCKDCKYWQLEHYVGGQGMSCQMVNSDDVCLTEPTHFCSWAERREE